MTAPELVFYAFIGGLLSFALIVFISLLVILRLLRNAPPEPTNANYIPAARTPYANGKTAEKEAQP
jgi:hypothetical protein